MLSYPDETTPTEINSRILAAFLDRAGSPPTFVPVRAVPEAAPLACHLNVPRHVGTHGGRAVSGWMAWTDTPGQNYLHFDAHAVWEGPDGTLVDITPQPDGEPAVLFAPDPRVVYRGRAIRPTYTPLVDDPLVAARCREYERLMAALSTLREHFGRMMQAPERLTPRERAERRKNRRKGTR